MNNLELGYYPLGLNYGYYIDKAPQNVLEELGQQINTLQSDFSKGEKHNNYLAGEIEHEYKIIPQFQTKQYVKELAQRFENESHHIYQNYFPVPILGISDSMWVNFQKKYEYNPIHKHYGIFSYVIWYKIPFTFENELKYNYQTDKSNCPHGKFTFIYPNAFSNQANIVEARLPIDNSKEGYIAIFPSSLSHMVYPFYSSDEYRITIAGNVVNVR